jgi:hypothetical protein
MKIKNSTSTIKFELILVVVAMINLFVFIAFSYKKFAFNSDSAAKVILASEIYSTGSLFPANWYYANNDLWVVFGHLFVLPLLKFFPPGYFVHSLAGLCAAVLIFHAAWLVTGSLGISLKSKLIVIAVLASCFSLRMTEHVFGQVSYGITIATSLYLIYFSHKFLFEPNINYSINFISPVILVFLAFVANPERALIQYFLPVLFSTLIATWILGYSGQTDITKKNSILGKKSWIFGMALILVAITGYFLHVFFSARVLMQPGYAVLSFDNPQNLGLNFLSTIQYLVALLGGEPVPGRAVKSISGVYDLAKAFFSLTLLAMFCYTFKKCIDNFKCNTSFRSFLFTYIVTYGGLVAFIISTTTTLKHPNYLIAPTFLFSILVVSHFDQLSGAARIIQRTLAALVVILSLSINTSAWYGYQIIDGGGGPIDGPHVNGGVDSLLEILIQNGQTYGYATYWYAGLITTLSDGKVKARPVGIGDGLISPQRWLSSECWYSPDAHQGETFLVLLTRHSNRLDVLALKKYGISLSRTVKFDEYTIFIFDQNNFSNTPNWKLNTTYLHKCVY